MTTEIDTAVSYEKVITKRVKIDLPDKAKYYSQIDDSNFFPRGLVLFAILPRADYDSNESYRSYSLIEVERNIQKYDDFVPLDDCNNTDWLKETGIRKTAFNIMANYDFSFKEITREEFETKRIQLLSYFKINT